MANAFQPQVFPNQNDYYGQYGFLTKLSADGSSLAYSTYFAGSTNIVQSCNGQPLLAVAIYHISGVAIDGSGNALRGRLHQYLQFPVTEGAYQTFEPHKLRPISRICRQIYVCGDLA